VLALAILFGLFALATLPARRYEADALLLARGSNVAELARSYAEEIVHPSFLAAIRPRIRPIDGHRLSDEKLRASISARSVDSAGLVHVTARADSAEGAEALANDVAVAFGVAVKQEAQQHEASVRDELRFRVAQRTREISRLRTGGTTAVGSERLSELEAERKALDDQLAKASVLGARQSVGPVLVAAPRAALEPLLPPLLRRLFEGLLLGAVVGLAVRRLLAFGARGERRARRVPVPHEAAAVAPPSPDLDWQLFDDLKPVARTARPDPGLARKPAPKPEPESPPQPVVRAMAPPPRPVAHATLSLVADPPLPPADPPVVPEPVPAPVALLPRQADMLELSELERLVAAHPASDPYLQEERHALLVSLRGYTGLDGVIPTRFHSLVHESFGDLLRIGSAVGVSG
jgi:hypothetical protein